MIKKFFIEFIPLDYTSNDKFMEKVLENPEEFGLSYESYKIMKFDVDKEIEEKENKS
jgi:hypothetical protein